MLNGDGLRVVLWVAGCNHCCRDCQNPITWDPNGGLAFTEAEEAEIFTELDKDYISGITFSGGDPLHPSNISAVTAFAKKIRERYPDKTIWLYTGSTWEEIQNEAVVQYLDVSFLQMIFHSFQCVFCYKSSKYNNWIKRFFSTAHRPFCILSNNTPAAFPHY